jgi:hypothetical protein
MLAAPAMLLACAVLLPFLGKAYTSDDHVFLKQAEHLLRDPLHPTAFDLVSYDDVRQRLSSWHTSGPGMAYLLVPAVLESGSAGLAGSERVAHLTQLICLCVALFGVVSLSLRLGLLPDQARVAGLLLAGTPAALAMTGTAMPDVPAMAFGAVAMDRILAWRHSPRWSLAVEAAASLMLATVMRMHLVLLLGIAALALCPWPPVPRALFSKRLAVLIAPLLLAPALLAAALWITRDPHPETGEFASGFSSLTSWAYIPNNFFAFLGHWVLVFPMALPWAVLRRKAIHWPRVGLLALGLAALGHLAPLFAIPVWRAAVLALGAAMLWDCFAKAWREGDQVQIVLSTWLLLPLAALMYQHMPPKYLLGCAPAAAILVAHLASFEASGLRYAVVGGAIAAGVLMAILIMRADSEMMDLGRQAAKNLIAPRVAAGEHVWFAGHWGFPWYAEKAGARMLSRTAPYPSPGDVIVVSRAEQCEATDVVPKYSVIQVVTASTPGGRIMSRADNAGFYSQYWGSLPWAWGHDEVNRFEVWKVE